MPGLWGNKGGSRKIWKVWEEKKNPFCGFYFNQASFRYLCFIFKYLYFTLKYKYFKCLGAEIWNIFQKDLGPQFYFLPLTYFYHPWAPYQTHPKSIPHPSTLPISQPTQTHCGKPCAGCCGISSWNQTQLMPLWNSWGEWLLRRRVTYNTYGATLCETQIHVSKPSP